MIILGKVRPFSRPHAEAHPQVLIIAPRNYRTRKVAQAQAQAPKVGRSLDCRVADVNTASAELATLFQVTTVCRRTLGGRR